MTKEIYLAGGCWDMEKYIRGIKGVVKIERALPTAAQPLLPASRFATRPPVTLRRPM